MKTVKPGIRRKPNGKYLATKSIDSKRYYKECDTLTEAMSWKNKFHPLLRPVIEEPQRIVATAPDKRNGGDIQITFKEVLERYRNGMLKNCSTIRQYKKGKRMDRFLPPLHSVRMCEMTPEVITKLLEEAKLTVSATFGRQNFDVELKDLSSIFNWYKTIDFTFANPVQPYHKKIGHIRDAERKKKVLTEAQLIRFINALPEPFQSMAVIQFCFALRIGEVAGLNTSTVDFESKTVSISEVITWVKNIPKHERRTKTGDETEFTMNDEIFTRLKVLDEKRPKGCKFFFHHKGKPMRYDIINYAYNDGLKKAGLSEFSGTHLIRHTMGTLTRRKSGLDAAQAILRHTTSRMAEHYAKLDVNEKTNQVVIDAGEIFRRGRATIATNSNETVESLAT